MNVKQVRDGTFIIIGITFAELEDLISAYDSAGFLIEWRDDLYDDDDPMKPIRDALKRRHTILAH